MKLDVLGLPLEEAIEIIEKNYSDINIEIKKFLDNSVQAIVKDIYAENKRMPSRQLNDR